MVDLIIFDHHIDHHINHKTYHITYNDNIDISSIYCQIYHPITNDIDISSMMNFATRFAKVRSFDQRWRVSERTQATRRDTIISINGCGTERLVAYPALPESKLFNGHI